MENIDYRNIAFEAESFIRSMRNDGEGGALWQRAGVNDNASHNPIQGLVPKSIFPHNLYHGSAGILLFYLELAEETGDNNCLEVAVSAGKEISRFIKEGEEFIGASFNLGWGGYVLSLNELYEASRETLFRDHARMALENLKNQATDLGSGIGWIEPSPFTGQTEFTDKVEITDLSTGSAGAALTFNYAHQNKLHEEALAWAVAAADRLLEIAHKDEVGLRWLLFADMPWEFTSPNFSHGSSGVAYMLAELYQLTGEERFLDAAIAGARYVESRSYPVGEGHLVCHTEERKPPIFYLGVCHGPAGTGRLFYLLNQITGEQHWMDWLHGNMRGLLDMGAPEKRSRGFWNNAGQCCGDAGLGDYSLFLYNSTGEQLYLDLALRIAKRLIEKSEVENGKRWWPQAEDRHLPDVIEAQTGYFQGAAGIGSFFLHLHKTLKGEPHTTRLLDAPY